MAFSGHRTNKVMFCIKDKKGPGLLSRVTYVFAQLLPVANGGTLALVEAPQVFFPLRLWYVVDVVGTVRFVELLLAGGQVAHLPGLWEGGTKRRETRLDLCMDANTEEAS